MAKKNSSKTRTKEAQSSSQPRVQVLRGWSGINVADLAHESMKTNSDSFQGQTDLNNKNLTVQNNAFSCLSGSVETRPAGIQAVSGQMVVEPNPNGTAYDSLVSRGLSHVVYRKGRMIYVARPMMTCNLVDTDEFVRQPWGAYQWHNPDSGKPGFTMFKGRTYRLAVADSCPHTPSALYIMQMGQWSPGGIIVQSIGARDLWYTPAEDVEVWFDAFFADGIPDSVSIKLTDYSRKLGDENKWTPNGYYTEIVAFKVDPSTGVAHEVPQAISCQQIESVTCISSTVVNGVEEMIVMGVDMHGQPTILTGTLDIDGVTLLDKPRRLPDPTEPPKAVLVDGGTETELGNEITGYGSIVTFSYSYVNKFGSTAHGGEAQFRTPPDITPSTLDYTKFIKLMIMADQTLDYDAVDVYAAAGESTSPIFIGRIDATRYETINSIKYHILNWHGSMSNVSEWFGGNLVAETENTTAGPGCLKMATFDGRVYMWGNKDHPDRLYIGGNAGHELDMSSGMGGGWCDAEPGRGNVINAVHKWKTASGASIVCVLCGNDNSSLTKRFNVIEDSQTLDGNSAEKSFYLEEVANTVGVQSEHGSGVWMDGLYCVTRYGLTVTTMAMEYNSQIQSQVISDPVRPFFTNNLYANHTSGCSMVCIDGKIYLSFGTESDFDHDGSGLTRSLDSVILCFDVAKKAWYTYTVDNLKTHEQVKQLFNFDSADCRYEGLGIVTTDRILVLPTVNESHVDQARRFFVKLETGELGGSVPATDPIYLSQVDLNFDWFCGDANIDVVGVDIYGRHHRIHRHLHTDEPVYDYSERVRVDQRMENFHVVVSGMCGFRLTSIEVRAYPMDRRTGITRGFDSLSRYRDAHGVKSDHHHYIANYANLRETLMP